MRNMRTRFLLQAQPLKHVGAVALHVAENRFMHPAIVNPASVSKPSGLLFT